MNHFFASALISMEEIEPNLGSRVKFGGLLTLGIRRGVYETSAYSKRCETNSRYTNHERPATSGFRFNIDLYGGFGPRMR